MQTASRVHRTLAVLSGVAVLALMSCGAFAQEDKKAKDKDKADTSKKVKFNSYDGVELSGTFYPKLGTGKDKDACVILLHNFDRIKGGNSHQDGWDHLAEELQKEGYSVLSFDFRGFGDSRQVAKGQFWDRVKSRHNQILRNAARMPETIEFKEFPPAYYPNLVNDIAAARAYLDHKNDAREVNTSNLILVGAGEGATLGSLWLESECKRKRMRGYLPDGRPDLDEPEARDVACAVWLSLSSSLANMRQPSLTSWLADAGGDNHIPIGFLYGGDDQAAKEYAKQCVSYITSRALRGRSGKLEFTVAQELKDTNLKGSQLLTKALGTDQMICNYLDRVMEKRGAREARSRDPLKTAYVWSFKTGMPITAKTEQEDLLRAVPLSQLGVPGQ